MNVTFSLDELLASLEVVEKEKVAAEQLQTTPPKIIVTNVPATLVMIDGEPKLQPVEQTRKVTVRVSDADHAAVSQGLKSGEDVAAKGAFELLSVSGATGGS